MATGASNAPKAESDLNIYRMNSDQALIQKDKQQEKDIYHQKMWVVIHVIVFITIAIKTIYLLSNKQSKLQNFYSSQEQCCYCAWVARNDTFNNHREIEYSQCWKKYHEPYYKQAICTNATKYQYCAKNDQQMTAEFQDHKVSTSSQFLFIPFPKFYPYYGSLGLVLVILYSLVIIIATFKYLIRLSSLLFVGNIVVAIQCFYNYLKAYQYTKVDYPQDAMCSIHPLPTNIEHSCYQSTLGRFISDLLFVMVSFFLCYFIYPFIFCCFECCIAKYPQSHKCSVIKSKVQRALLYIGIVGGIFSIFLCFVVLMVVEERTTSFELSFFNERWEKYNCIFVGITLLISSFSVFCLPHCRSRCCFILQAGETLNWKDRIHSSYEQSVASESDDFDDEEDKTIDLTMKSRRSDRGAHKYTNYSGL